jgi:hypothetical protein
MRLRPAIRLKFALALSLAAPAFAQALPPANAAEDIVGINGSDGGSTGRTAVNAAAGNRNQQANVAVIAIGETAVTTGAVVQSSDALAVSPSAYKSATITENAFANSSGMVAVAVTAGSANQQANLAVFGIGNAGRAVTDAMLSQARAQSSPGPVSEDSAAPEIVTGVSPGAFAGSVGLVQLTLVGGDRNSSANIFVLTAPGSTEQ